MTDVRRLDSLERTVRDTKLAQEDTASTVLARLGTHEHDYVSPGRQIVAGTGLAGGGDLSADRALAVVFGSSAGTAAQGNHTHTLLNNSVTIGGNLQINGVLNGPGGELDIDRITGGAGSINFKIQSDPSFSGWRFFWSGSTVQFVRNDTNTVVKTFVIDHPDRPGHYLVHATTESPQNGVEYWGTATIQDHVAVIELPSYFESLTSADGQAVVVTPVAGQGDESVAGEASTPSTPEWMVIPSVAASVPRNGRFRIVSDGADGSEVTWLVKAVRKDVPPLEVEPQKSEQQLNGDGPYTYLTPRTMPVNREAA